MHFWVVFGFYLILLPVHHQVSEALELTVTEPWVATQVQVLQGVKGKEGLVAHAPEQVVREVDLLHVPLRQVLERHPVHLHQLVGAQVNLAQVAERWELVSSQPGFKVVESQVK